MKDWLRTPRLRARPDEPSPLRRASPGPLTMGVRAMAFSTRRATGLPRSAIPMSRAGICQAAASSPARRCAQSLARELREETGLALRGRSRTVFGGLSQQPIMANRDHVALYVLRHDRAASPIGRVATSKSSKQGFFRPRRPARHHHRAPRGGASRKSPRSRAARPLLVIAR